MLLWRSKETREITPKYPDLGIRTWRWVFEVELDRGLSVSIYEQVQFRDDGDWRHATTYYTVWLNSRWTWGWEYAYYDGAHHSLSFGLLHFCWSAGMCKKCVEGTHQGGRNV